MNIASQFLQTDGDVGYVVIEADGTREDCEQVLEEIRALEGTHARPHHLRALIGLVTLDWEAPSRDGAFFTG